MATPSFFENIGGFFLNPKRHTLKILEEDDCRWELLSIQSNYFVKFNAMFAGVVLMFYMMYPEVFIVPEVIHTGNLFLYAAASPLFIVGMFALGYILVGIFDIRIQGSLSYWITKRALKSREEPKELFYVRFISLYSFTHIPMTIFYAITTFWMFFFEKFSYTKIFFPVTDLTLPVIIHFLILFAFLILKWVWEIRMKIAIFEWAEIPKSQTRESIIISFLVRLWLVAVVFICLYFAGNIIAGAQWS